MRHAIPALCCSLLLGPLLGCDAGPDGPGEASYTGPEVEVAVAALDLAGVSDAEYRVTVRNGDSKEVWQRRISSEGFGDGQGALAYVGPCDAEANPNQVELEIVALFSNGSALGETTYVNPAPLGDPLVLSFDCEDDQDVSVEFNLTILRSANEGFFDIAVAFNNVFCSAKFDCRDDDGGPKLLLPNPFTPTYEHGMTTILAFACTGDPSGEGSTALYLDDIRIVCEDQTWVIDPSGGPGTLDNTSISPDPGAGTYLYGASVYLGEEEIADKLFWNLAIGLDPAAFAAAGDCVLTTRATAADSDLGHVTPPMTTYPYIEWSVPLTDASGLVCTTHALDGVDDKVTVQYTDIETPITFDHELQYTDLGDIPTAPGPPDSVKKNFTGAVGGVDTSDIYQLRTKGGADVVWHDVVFERKAGSTEVRLRIYTDNGYAPTPSDTPIAELTGSAISIPAATIAAAGAHPQRLWVIADSQGATGTYSFDVWLCTKDTGCVTQN